MHRKFQIIIATSFIFILSMACSNDELARPNPYQDVSAYLEELPAYPQRSGDPGVGREYLIYGDYVDSGIPEELYEATFGQMLESNNELQRDRNNENIHYSFTRIEAGNGVPVVVPNCMQCHAGSIDGQFVMGLGNNMVDNTLDQGLIAPVLETLVVNNFGEDSPEYEAFIPFYQAISATSGQLVTDVVGVSAADKLAVVLAAHRTQDDLQWSNEPLREIPSEVIPADIPAWWLLKKKHAMFSTGIGRQDFARVMMASSILTMQDSSKAREVDNQFGDVLQYIYSLEAPSYPGPIDAEMAVKGKEIFLETCSKCHGTYGPDGRYPNYLVKHEILETDPTLANTNYAYDSFVDWYNDSWFAKGPYAAKIVPTEGYVAQPLDGVWATAPYLHNGSIPTLWDLLNSSSRPDLWTKSQDEKNYDHQKMGIKYTVPENKISKFTYDTSKPGYGNQGHYFGDHLTDDQRWAVIEYLKTL